MQVEASRAIAREVGRRYISDPSYERESMLVAIMGRHRVFQGWRLWYTNKQYLRHAAQTLADMSEVSVRAQIAFCPSITSTALMIGEWFPDLAHLPEKKLSQVAKERLHA